MSDLPARLVFTRHTDHGLPARLAFGDGDVETGGNVTLHSSAKLSGLRGYVRGRVGVKLGGSGRITGLRGYLAGRYNVNVERPLVGQVRDSVQAAGKRALLSADAWQDGLTASAHVQQHLQQAQRAAAVMSDRWQDTVALYATVQQHQQQARRLVAVVDQSFQDALPLHTAVVQRVQQAARLVSLASGSFEDAVQLRAMAQHRLQQAERLYQVARHAGGSAKLLLLHHAERTQQAMRPGIGVRPPVTPEPAKPCHPGLPALLCFELPATSGLPARLYFHCCGWEPEVPPATIVIPVRRTYIVFNSIMLHRVDTGDELMATGFSMQLDHQSWTWSWSATLHASASHHLGRGADGYPAELEVTINSIPVRLRLTQKSITEPFLPHRIRVGGKGKSAVLAGPYAPDMTFSAAADRTAQQLMNEALTVNGVSLGWDVEWGIPDWLVPADTWSLQGSYIDAVQDIANAAGAYVQPHNTAAALRILPEYPVAPWHWAGVTPDYELPAGVASVVDIDEVDNPYYNAVWLSGLKSGVFGPFGRAGTPKDEYAPQVVHSLITDATVHRGRGLAEIARSGRKQMVTLNTMVLPEAGLIMPGKFLRFQGTVGLVRSVGVDWQRPRLRQKLVLETYQDA